MKFTPRPYGAMMVEFMLNHERCNIWGDMGVGKTSSGLTVLDALTLFEDPFPALIIGPKRVARSVWTGEAAKWDHLKHLKIVAGVGSDVERRRAFMRRADITTINYENIPWLIDCMCKGGGAWPFRTVIADESTKIKGFRLRSGGMRAAKLGRVCTRPKRWINLTGTPAPNGLLDLWGQQYFIDQGARLGLSFTGFKERWFRPHPNGKSNWLPLPFAEAQVHAALADCTLTIRAKDWFDLQEPIVTNVYVDLPARALKSYREMENKMFMELNGVAFEAFSAAAKSQKCLQMASGAVYLNQAEDVKPLAKKPYVVAHDEKLDALEEIIEEAAGNPVLVAYHFVSDLERIKKRFKQARELKTTKDEDDWNAGRIDLLLAHPASAGHGLNLQHGGHRIVFFSNDWNLEYRQQMIERIGPVRQLQSGYSRPVYIYNLLARGTLDEAVLERLSSKASVQDILRDAMVTRRAA